MMQKSPRTRLRMGVGLCALSAALCQTVPALAEDAQDLGKMVVSANRTATPISMVGSSVSVVTSEEMEKQQNTTALEALKETPSITSWAFGGRGTSSDIMVRGLPSNNVMVMIDGMVMTTAASTSPTFDLDLVSSGQIDSIEFLRGSQSTLYGSNASTGVISINTKTGKNMTEPFAGSTTMETGTYNTYKLSSSAMGRVDDFYYGLTVHGATSDGFDGTNGNRSNGGDKDGWRNQGLNVKLGADVIKNVGVLDLLNVETSGYMQTALTEVDSNQTDVDQSVRNAARSGRIAVNADTFQGVLSNTASVARSETRVDYFNAGGNRNNSSGWYDGDRTLYTYQATVNPVEDHVAVFGVERRRDHMQTVKIDSKTMLNDGYFANYQISFLDKTLILAAGARQEDNDKFGDYTTYRFTSAYRIPEWGTRLHASYGTSFSAPTLSQLYYPAQAPGYQTVGNPDLKPEESRNIDFGIDQDLFDKRLKVESTAFKTNIDNMISYWYTIPGDSKSSRFFNVSSVRSIGLENSVTGRLDKEWSGKLSYTYAQSRDNTRGLPLTRSPHDFGSARLTYAPLAVEGLETYAKTNFQSRSNYMVGSNQNTATATHLGGFATFDLGASYQINDWAKAFGRVENILDKDYVTSNRGYASPGRAGYVGLTLNY
jgi:vitamin B12 transporter